MILKCSIKIPAALLVSLMLIPLTGTGVSANSHSSSAFQEQQQSTEELRQLSGDEFEIGYINRIVPHHQGAVEMSEMLQPKIVHQQLLDDTAQIIEDQQMEIQQLTNYLNTTYGQDLIPDERFMMSQDMMAQMQSAAPETAEIMYLLMMREHHQSAIALGEIVLEKTDSPVLIDQAEKMIAAQQEEQQRFAQYLSEWYGIDAPEPTGNMQTAMEFAMSATQMPGMPNTGAGGMANRGDAGLSPLLSLVAALFVVAVAGGGYLARRRFA